MGSPILPLLVLLACAAATAARPCKTIFYFSATTTTTTTTTSYNPYDYLSGNPNPNSLSQEPRHLTLIFTASPSIRFPGYIPSLDFNSDNSVDDSVPSLLMTSADLPPLKFYSSVSNSIRDRTRDIMSVVGALLFGVACGALTAATMYFLWALFSPRRFDLDDASSDDDDDDDKVAMSKKFGYVAIPAMPKVVDDDLKKPAPTANEVV